ncbi:hypothetical protein [Coprococcus eutactus]|uniref:hypothetical protein n=1 Tax=Coprococcus eutactus TaxID=33043 RepID=UPI003219A598
MSKRDGLPSKSISFRLVTEMADAPKNKDGKVMKYPNDLDRQVYNILCNLPDGTNISHFVKQAIIAYAKIDYSSPNYSASPVDYDIIHKMIAEQFSRFESRLDRVEKSEKDINVETVSDDPNLKNCSMESSMENKEKSDEKVPDEMQEQSTHNNISDSLDILNETDDDATDLNNNDDDLELSDSWLNIL